MTVKLPGLHAHMPMLTVNVGAAPPLRWFDKPLLAPTPAAEPKRRRIWELSGNFHCSIIGTCLTTSELRQILVKMQVLGAHKESDHELHGRAVLLAGQKDQASILLQKALDRRHRSVISQFSKALTADGGNTWFLPRMVGMRRAQQLFLLNRRLTAEEALEFGLVSRLADSDVVEREARALAAKLAIGPTRAYGAVRRMLRRSFETGLSDQLNAEKESIVAASRSDDAREGIAAFIAKRHPNFCGE